MYFLRKQSVTIQDFSSITKFVYLIYREQFYFDQFCKQKHDNKSFVLDSNVTIIYIYQLENLKPSLTLIALFCRCNSRHKFSRRLRVRIALLWSACSSSFSLWSKLHFLSVCLYRTCLQNIYIDTLIIHCAFYSDFTM